MRFKTVDIKEAGPVKIFKTDFGNANLIIGDNEQGKTTLIDILIQSMYPKKNASKFAAPVLNKRFDFSAAETVMEGGPLSEEMQKFATLFIIREGENVWAGRTAKQGLLSKDLWNRDIKEMLYGHDALYNKISRDFGETLGVSNARSWMNRLRQNVQTFASMLSGLVKQVEDYKDNEGFTAERNARLQQVEAQLAGLSDARKNAAGLQDRETIEKYFELADRTAKITADREAIDKKNLPQVRSEWDAVKKEAEALDREVREWKLRGETTERVMAERSKIIDGLEKQITDLKKNIAAIDLDEHKLEAGVEVKAEYYDKELEKLEKEESASRWPAAGFLIGLGVLGLASALLWFIKILPLGVFGYVTAAVSSLLIIIGFIVLNTGVKEADLALNAEQTLQAEKELLYKNLDSQKAGFAKNREVFEGLLVSNLEKIESLKIPLQNNAHNPEINQKMSRLEALKEKIRDLTALHHSYEEVVRLLETRKNYSESLEMLSREMTGIKQKLKGRFGTDSASLLGEELKKIRESSASENSAGYSEEKFEKLSRERDDIRNKVSVLKESNQKIEGDIRARVSEGIKNLGNEVNPGYLSAFYSSIQSFNLSDDIFNIYHLESGVKKFLTDLERDIRFSETLAEIYSRMQGDLDGLLHSVFETKEFAATLSRLTSGACTGASFKTGEAIELDIIREDGSSYSFDNLSTGMRNQIYFAFRLALANVFFKDEKGIFILDDAFITYDSSRRKCAVEILKDYVSKGWQVIYAGINETGMEEIFTSVFGKDLKKIKV